VVGALADHGFEPRRDEGRFVLSNCPFRVLAREAPGVVCGMNLALVQGVLEGAGTRSASARLEPGEGRCCVTVVDKEGTDDE
jgi:predicted ArsR family transcriptional regulator